MYIVVTLHVSFNKFTYKYKLKNKSNKVELNCSTPSESIGYQIIIDNNSVSF